MGAACSHAGISEVQNQGTFLSELSLDHLFNELMGSLRLELVALGTQAELQ